ncbi:hypothetical protein [Candidatus Ruminimicrobiellum ovillum]|uniref:hypothetical protein n=1 Tax=Candidatus Ruminimicrobiellum ovillum TaxID=1947927 RepID=UPI00355A216C
MKKIQVLIISLLFLITNNIQASFLQGPNPYSFGPEGRTVSDLRDFAKPKQMARILPNRPVVATDSSGSRVYYTPDGKLALSIGKDGSMSFSLGGINKSYNSDGEFSGMSKTIKGSGLLQEVYDKEERLIGYKTLNGDGKVSRTYDKDKNLTATYVYTGQGAKLDYVQNEMTGGRSYYDEYGRNKVDVDFNGYIQRTYLYADVEYTVDESDVTRKTLKTTKTKENPTNTGLLSSVRDYNHNMYSTNDGKVDINPLAFNETFFDLEGKTQYIKNTDGYITREYFYKQDDKGNKIIDYHLDNLTKNKTYYDEHGTASYTVNDQNAVITRYFDGYTVNVQSDGAYSEVTKYDIDGKELYTTLKNIDYNDDGTINKVMDEEDDVWQEYHYTKDNDGNKIIDYVINYSDNEFGNKQTYTWYENGKPMYVTITSERPTDDKSVNIVKDFSWNGDTLVYTFDRKTETTQWYNMDKDLVYESLNERVISKNIYSKGQLVGKWDAQKGETTIFINERSWISVVSDYEPTADMVTALIAHSAEIDNAISKHEEEKVLDKLMDNFGWKAGAATKLLTTGGV